MLVRHGESVANAAGVLLGRADSPLTNRGRSQAAEIAATLGAVSRLVTSPLARARETAEALGLDIAPEIDERWIEVDYGTFEGRPLAEIPRSQWAAWRRDPTTSWPGGESLADVGERVRRSCEELFAVDGQGARGEGDVVVVSHVSPIKASVAWALGVGDEVAWRMYLATGSLTRVAWGTQGPVLYSYNDTSSHDERGS